MTNPASPVPDREELLKLLGAAARKGHVGAARLLLAELAADEAPEEPETEPDEDPFSVITELAARRLTEEDDR